MSDPTVTSRWLVARCPYCDEHGYLPNGFRCPHESPEVAAERAHRGAALARAEVRPTADLAAESAARLATDEQETA
jgi:hypothetical protein